MLFKKFAIQKLYTMLISIFSIDFEQNDCQQKYLLKNFIFQSFLYDYDL